MKSVRRPTLFALLALAAVMVACKERPTEPEPDDQHPSMEGDWAGQVMEVTLFLSLEERFTRVDGAISLNGTYSVTLGIEYSGTLHADYDYPEVRFLGSPLGGPGGPCLYRGKMAEDGDSITGDLECETGPLAPLTTPAARVTFRRVG